MKKLHVRNTLLQGVVFASYLFGFFIIYLILDNMFINDWWLHYWLHTTIRYPIWTYYVGQIIIALLVFGLLAFTSFILGHFTVSKLKLQLRDELDG